MTPTDLQAIRRRLAVMSPGPWNWKAVRYYANEPSLLAAGNWALNGPRTIEDAEVCAHAPTDLAALLAEVERLRDALDEREGDMHLRIRRDYDKAVSDAWKAWAAKIEAQRDEARADINRLKRWTLKDGHVEADLGGGWSGNVGAYEGRFPWSVYHRATGRNAVGIADTFEEAKAAAEDAAKDEE